jgi:Holliday junction resolvasome RuvABC endonuclease subunit
MAADLAWPNYTVFGIDPSMASTGWSVVRFTPYGLPTLLGHGKVTTPPGEDSSMKTIVERSHQIFMGITGAYSAWMTPWHAAIELPVPTTTRGHQGGNSQSGSIMVACVYNAILQANPQCDVGLYYPNHTKKVVTGNGRAEKSEVKEDVIAWLGGTAPRFNTDVSDSIAAAITYALEHLE